MQWDATCWTRAPLLVDRILRVLHPVPLHWNFPAFPWTDTGASGLAPVLRERLASAGDSLLAMGCTGACQPVLGLKDLDREIAWGLRNPWSTGLADVFGRRPAAIAPRLPDLDRPGAAALFLRHGLALVGTAVGDRTLTFSGHYGLRVFPYTRLPGAGTGRQALDANLRRLMALCGDVFVMIDLAALPAAPAAAAPLIEIFAERVLGSGRTIVPLAEAALEGETRQPVNGCASTEAAEWRLFPATTLRRRLEASEGLRRRRRRRSDETRDLLAQLSAATPDPPVPAPGPPRRYTDRGLIAHMQGEATLSGDIFDVRLAGGRFCGLARGREALTPQRPAVSWLRVNGRTFVARGRSAFSFEGDDGTGLREDLVLEPGGSLVVDYTFRVEHAFLAIEAAFTFPALPPETIVDEWAPLVFALAEVPPGREVPVAFEAPDGSTGTCLVAERDGWRPAAGSRFRVKTGALEIVLATGSDGLGAWGLFLFRIAKVGRGRRVLEVNPFGAAGPVPAAPLAGSRGSFGFTIGLGRP
ncbi:MAG: hypothetical protein NTU62_15885 [Spirochaetes bacterium]|nr:hypothetical protein [Spirochaetota bacterium]